MNRLVPPIPMPPDGDSRRCEEPDLTGCGPLPRVDPRSATGEVFAREEPTVPAGLTERRDLVRTFATSGPIMVGIRDRVSRVTC
ncbi:hypothetical protein ACFSKW_17410 [Nonomuraea mangrovi]|uniref:Uncharacterized protein n=1 Tax=Nonomuraea mangrovi TaxID=2316207 RepID=A0ABW4SXC2_9ACTN